MRSLRLATILAALLTLGALAAAPAAFAGRTIRLKFPRFAVPPNSDREVCTFVQVPMRHPYDMQDMLIANIGGNAHFQTHHFLMYEYTGTDPGAFPPRGQIVDSKGCLDFGPTDRNSRVLIGGSQSPVSHTQLPVGLAQHMEPKNHEVGIILNSHWINGSDEVQYASVKIRMTAARRHTVKRYLQPIFEVVANSSLYVPPGQQKTTGWSWEPGVQDPGAAFGGVSVPKAAACVTSVTAHMHKRGKLFTVDFVQGRNTSTEIFRATDYADPGQRTFNPPLLVSPGEKLSYTCMHDNGVTDAVKMGCEETPGQPPGISAFAALFGGRGLTGAAKRCASDADCPATDPAYPNRQFTGKCVPANLVFGFTSDDDMCILPGSYYDAIAGAAPGAECDLTPLPIIN